MYENRETPFWDTSKTFEERIRWLLESMTVDEKLKCLASQAPDLDRLGIPGMSAGGEAAHGVEARNDQNELGRPEPTTTFIEPIGMSATWDPELLYKAGEVTGTEARVIYHRHPDRGLCRWAPTVDLERDPRWGRTEEGYGEDPFLTGEMASAYVRGMQGDHPKYLRVAATLKHFYGNNTELGRAWKNASIDPRNKYELYLESFRRVLEKGRAEAVMTAYNRINGVPGIANPEVQKILKDQYGLHHVVSDAGAMEFSVVFHHYKGTQAEVLAEGIKAGVDAVTENAQDVENAAKKAWEMGLLTEADIDRALTNMFTTKLRLGIYDKENVNPFDRVTESNLDSEEHRKICLQVSREAVVLLKNEEHCLPLNKKDGEDIALIGPVADAWYYDWYGGIPSFKRTLKDGIEKITGTKAVYTDGLDRILLKYGDKGVAVNEDGDLCLSEQPDTFIMEDWDEGSIVFRCERTGKYVNTRFYAGKDKEPLGSLGADKDSVLDWYVMEIFGIRTCGEGMILTDRFGHPVSIGQDQHLYAAEGENPAVFQMEQVRSGLGDAVKLAGKKKTVILALGCNPMINAKEEVDRSTIMLPKTQQKLAEEIMKVNPNVIVVLLSDYPYGLGKIHDKGKGIVWSATGAQDMGDAVAETIFGENAPAGRLNMTWYKEDSQLPHIDDYDIIKNGRTYRYFTGDVLYPFGHGLTYAPFDYQDLTVQYKNNDTLKVDFKVTNKGTCISDEVAQVYVTAPASRVKRPVRQLVGFQRLKNVRPGETRQVTLSVPVKELEFYDVIRKMMVVEKGNYKFMAGSSSACEKVSVNVEIDGTVPSVRTLTERIPADHYDDYENIELDLGHMGYTAVTLKNRNQAGQLIYGNCKFDKNTDKIVLHMRSCEGCRIHIKADGYLIGSWEGSTKTYVNLPPIPMDSKTKIAYEAAKTFWKPVYSDVYISLKFPEICEDKIGTLSMEIMGDVELCYFYTK